MVDIDLLVKVLRRSGHTVETVYPVPDNAGTYELSVDGTIMPLDAARHLLEVQTLSSEKGYRKPA